MQDFNVISKLYNPKEKKNASLSLHNTLKKQFKYVSISHKGNRLVGLGSIKPCGIDIERQSYKHAAFNEFVLNVSEIEIIKNPILAWTVKESCYKVKNDGYEPSDFIIFNLAVNNYSVSSTNFSYDVEVKIEDDHYIALAFLS